MKNFILLTLTLSLVNVMPVASAQEETGNSLKYEGSCSGTLADGTAISFNYYSDFDGCKDLSQSALTYTTGLEGLLTGTRSFQNGKDLHTYPEQQLEFADSTGNTTGVIHLINLQGEKESVNLQCDIRDYEYMDC